MKRIHSVQIERAHYTSFLLALCFDFFFKVSTLTQNVAVHYTINGE